MKMLQEQTFYSRKKMYITNRSHPVAFPPNSKRRDFTGLPASNSVQPALMFEIIL